MIVGVILRNFKNFRNQHYIPLTVNARSSWLIGENGVGKSSILQALDTILNKNDFNKLDINNDARSQGLLTREPFIVPIFLIRKEKIRSNASIYKTLEVISDITWQIESEDFNLLQRTLAEKFVAHRTLLEEKYSSSEYFLIPIGSVKKGANDTPTPTMSIFESIEDYHVELESLIPESTSVTSNQRKYFFQIALYRTLDHIKEIYNY
ncbi:TPA: AAA family ATPase, partial [Klebsiella variicola]